jgi:hypothetical protein
MIKIEGDGSWLGYAFFREATRTFFAMESTFQLSDSMIDANLRSLDEYINFELVSHDYNGKIASDDYKAYLGDFLAIILRNKRQKSVFVAEVGLGRDILSILDRDINIDSLVITRKRLEYIQSFINSYISKGRLNLFYLSISDFTPPPGTYYDGVLFESLLAYLNKDKVVQVLTNAIAWPKPPSYANYLQKVLPYLQDMPSLHGFVRNLDELVCPKRIISFRLKQSPTGCVYVSSSGVGERYFTTWTETEIADLVQSLTAAGAQVLLQKIDTHADAAVQADVPVFVQIVIAC